MKIFQALPQRQVKNNSVRPTFESHSRTNAALLHAPYRGLWHTQQRPLELAPCLYVLLTCKILTMPLRQRPRIFLSTPPPLYRNGVYSMNQTVIGEVMPRILKAVAMATNVSFIDMATPLGGTASLFHCMHMPVLEPVYLWINIFSRSTGFDLGGGAS